MSAQLLDHEWKDFYNYEDHSTALTSNYSSGKTLNLELKMQQENEGCWRMVTTSSVISNL
jgi:hypothetical protein